MKKVLMFCLSLLLLGCGIINKEDRVGLKGTNSTGMTREEYSLHYEKMKQLLESIPWKKVVKNPRNPEADEYPKKNGTYITMMDCNEHEVCTNEFKDGQFTWMNKTHIKWWMKLPE